MTDFQKTDPQQTDPQQWLDANETDSSATVPTTRSLDQMLLGWAGHIAPDEARLAALTETVLQGSDLDSRGSLRDPTPSVASHRAIVSDSERWIAERSTTINSPDRADGGPTLELSLSHPASNTDGQECPSYNERCAVRRSLPVPRRDFNGMAAVACAAACLLFVVTLATVGSNRHDARSLANGPAGKTPSSVMPDNLLATQSDKPSSPQEDIAAMAGLWRDNMALFGSDMEWLCDLDDELLLHLRGEATSDQDASSSNGGSVAKPPMVCVVLSIRERAAGTNVWSNRWTCRLVCPVAESIDFASARHATSGSVWVQPVANGRFVVSHWLNCEAAPELSGLVEQACVPGEAQVLSKGISDGRETQLVQQVVPMGRS